MENFNQLYDFLKLDESPKNTNNFGILRINILRILVGLVGIHCPEIDMIFLSAGVYNRILKLMRVFSMNSTLHNSVVDLFNSSCYSPEKVLAIVRHSYVLTFLAKSYQKYSTGAKLSHQIHRNDTLQALCMKKIQRLNLTEVVPENLKKKTFGMVDFKASCHFMGHVMKITRIIFQQATLGTLQSKELKSLLEKHPTWAVTRQIPMVEEKLGTEGIPPK